MKFNSVHCAPAVLKSAGRRWTQLRLGERMFMKQFWIRLIRDEQGQDLVEYALLVAAIGLALVATVNQLSTQIISLYSSITQGLGSIGASGQ